MSPPRTAALTQKQIAQAPQKVYDTYVEFREWDAHRIALVLRSDLEKGPTIRDDNLEETPGLFESLSMLWHERDKLEGKFERSMKRPLFDFGHPKTHLEPEKLFQNPGEKRRYLYGKYSPAPARSGERARRADTPAPQTGHGLSNAGVRFDIAPGNGAGERRTWRYSTEKAHRALEPMAAHYPEYYGPSDKQIARRELILERIKHRNERQKMKEALRRNANPKEEEPGLVKV